MKYFIHKSSYVDDEVLIGEETKIWHFCHIQSRSKIGSFCNIGQNVNIGNNVIIGNHVKIQNNVSIYEGVILEDYVFCGPSIVFTNINIPRSKYPQQGSDFYEKTLVKYGASIGANATIVCGNTIGKHALVAAGSVVTKAVSDYNIVAGNPAKQIGWISEHGCKLDFNSTNIALCSKSNERYKIENSIVSKI